MSAPPPLYSICGLWLESNQTVPGLVPLAATPRVDLRVWFDQPPPSRLGESGTDRRAWYVSPYLDEEGEPWLTIWKIRDGAGYRLVYPDGAQFVVDREGARIWANGSGDLRLEDMATYLLGPVLGFVLRLRGVVCLHASAVVAGDGAIAILGPSGSGKSTTAAGFARRGHPVLTDDIAALWSRGDSFLIQPAHPRLRLVPEAIEALYGSTPDLSLTPTWQKLYLDLEKSGLSFRQQPLPRVVTTKPWSYGALIENGYVTALLDRTMLAQEFDFLTRLVSRIPLRRVTPHTDPARISDLCDCILDDLDSLTSGALDPAQVMGGTHVQCS